MGTKKKKNFIQEYKEKIQELSPSQQDAIKVLVKIIYFILIFITIIALVIIYFITKQLLFLLFAVVLVIPAQLIFNKIIKTLAKENDLPQLQ